jgi:hypothetical protein
VSLRGHKAREETGAHRGSAGLIFASAGRRDGDVAGGGGGLPGGGSSVRFVLSRRARARARCAPHVVNRPVLCCQEDLLLATGSAGMAESHKRDAPRASKREGPPGQKRRVCVEGSRWSLSTRARLSLQNQQPTSTHPWPRPTRPARTLPLRRPPRSAPWRRARAGAGVREEEGQERRAGEWPLRSLSVSRARVCRKASGRRAEWLVVCVCVASLGWVGGGYGFMEGGGAAPQNQKQREASGGRRRCFGPVKDRRCCRRSLSLALGDLKKNTQKRLKFLSS